MNRRLVVVVCVAMLSAVGWGGERTSDAEFILLNPDSSSFWRTATGNRMTLPVEFPSGATSVTLTVRGCGYETTASNIVPDAGLRSTSVEVALPEASSPSEEDYYEFVLSFDDGTVRTAKLGLIQGLSAEAEGSTRCLVPVDSRKWSKVIGRAVVPVPAGSASLSVDGKTVETGLSGAAGWYVLNGMEPGLGRMLSLSVGGDAYEANLLGAGGGIMIFIR